MSEKYFDTIHQNHLKVILFSWTPEMEIWQENPHLYPTINTKTTHILRPSGIKQATQNASPCFWRLVHITLPKSPLRVVCQCLHNTHARPARLWLFHGWLGLPFGSTDKERESLLQLCHQSEAASDDGEDEVYGDDSDDAGDNAKSNV